MTDSGLRTRTAAKPAEVEQKIHDLRTIRETLLQAVDAGCDDLATCAAGAAICLVGVLVIMYAPRG
ncbi:hypothetical protein [Nonomuraea sp. NPDC050691]|uniref:hypothetical protein n=1 Tax=Nonomuraea sp. NPDC050691 TaxID=3155661 RepID=UPI0033E805E7